ncbi:aspartate-semialdehyde dehydrogenase [Verminephrobacter aporrectodeae]|uniref:Aspartate-semialdehyde dehydrogenase n=1 Tax=Verminephrobacter aporrectodeae subsp. tuberculatae TaxID=1110392 RepID=A0ABT3KS77_9BURK|nr:aspartate-semialdehyde dehydrogenase [Verminephrobacter aporrectodeae]MCW5220407.1 aspartate-semialdehyde dehydrogenase [Verminephrobacter aporrectodeae subsp. tuberculatae]MCW5255638.1 aspartate-semialdehyde dehydrogenase [Verminephrobacter aporrectodeae subsp. tuberculatae]MCW5289703.1 aspartate-semialdehyde dehydrogenase [Verminephrobacter aporrectodeae subsp. tuberculatae]MCW5320660.1 aspartate-semialdehyde dehydrogenase [Verminephrobacter aporrectodeae subsp. tuberculatae]MCW8167249.1 
MKKLPSVGIVGATGAVGVQLIKCLEVRGFPLSSLRLFASARSAGKRLPFRGQDLIVEELGSRSFEGLDIALFSAGGSTSREYIPIAAKAGTVSIDNSSAFRMTDGVPLIVPEVNPQALGPDDKIIANPNCSTIIALVPLWPIHQRLSISRVVVSTYQAASGAGAAGMAELEHSTRAHLAGEAFAPQVFPHSYAFNVFSHNSKVDIEDGDNEEEAKMLKETRKIFSAPGFRISATCVRVPVMRAHCESLHVECEKPVDLEEVRGILSNAPGVRIVDDRAGNKFPMPVEASGQDDILVGRLRMDTTDPTNRSFWMFVSGDQLLKGAALNAVQIAELLLQK